MHAVLVQKSGCRGRCRGRRHTYLALAPSCIQSCCPSSPCSESVHCCLLTRDHNLALTHSISLVSLDISGGLQYGSLAWFPTHLTEITDLLL